MPPVQHEIVTPGPLLDAHGSLTQAGWARAPLLDGNLEQAAFYPRFWRFLQRFRVKRWDYYGVTTPERFFSATLADLGYAGQVFAYTIDFATGQTHEETLTTPLGRGVTLPRNSTEGDSTYDNGIVSLSFGVTSEARHLSVRWPDFGGQPLATEVTLRVVPEHDSTVVVIPIRGNRFYYNRKMNCLPATGWLQIGDKRSEIRPETCLGNLDWGRGVWHYRSFWVWASPSSFMPMGGQRQQARQLGPRTHGNGSWRPGARLFWAFAPAFPLAPMWPWAPRHSRCSGRVSPGVPAMPMPSDTLRPED